MTAVARDEALDLLDLARELLPLTEADPSLDWMTFGLCTQGDPETWFPEKGGSAKEAKRVCGKCPVREECLEYALARDERFGVWGGYTERERRDLARAASGLRRAS